MLRGNGNRVAEAGQGLPDELAHIQSGSLETSEPREDTETTSKVTESPRHESGDTNEPTIDHTLTTTDLRTYEVVDNEDALEQKVSDVSTSFQPLTVYQCSNSPRREIRNLQGM